MTNAEIIRGMLDLLDTSDKWVQYSEGRTAFGVSVNGNDPLAAQWCVGGAIVKVTGFPWWTFDFSGDSIMGFLNRRAREEGHTNFVTFNNSRFTTFEDVRLFLKCALIEAEEME